MVPQSFKCVSFWIFEPLQPMSFLSCQRVVSLNIVTHLKSGMITVVMCMLQPEDLSTNLGLNLCDYTVVDCILDGEASL